MELYMTEKTNLKTSNDEVSDTWQTALLKIGLAIVGAIILANLFPHAFDDKIILTNEMTGQKIEIPVETKRVNGEKEYCIKVSILEGDEHAFYSKDKDALTKFITKVKTAEMRARAEMQLKGKYIDNETTKFYSLDKMIYEIPKRQYHIYERKDKEQSTTQEKTLNSTIKEKDDTLKEYEEDAKKAGVSPKCLQYQMTGIGNESCCTKKESLKADKYLKKMADDEYCYDSTPVNRTNEVKKNQDVDDFMN